MRPNYLDKHPCISCGTGYINCLQYNLSNLKCCKQCDHPTRWTEKPPYTDEEMAAMNQT